MGDSEYIAKVGNIRAGTCFNRLFGCDWATCLVDY